MSQVPSADTDRLGVTEYRLGLGFWISYAILFVGLFVFKWDSAYIFLGVALELLFSIGASSLKAFLFQKKLSFPLALFFILPAAIVAAVACFLSLRTILAEDSQDWRAILGLILFLVSSFISSARRFQRTSLKQVRFYRYLDHKYQYESGASLFTPSSLVLGPVAETWLATGIFVASWLMASAAGGIQGGDGSLLTFNTTAGIFLALFGLLRQVIAAGIMHALYGKKKDQEALWIHTYSKVGPIVEREPTSHSYEG